MTSSAPLSTPRAGPWTGCLPWNVLRIGVCELLWAEDVPDGVAISEVVLLARGMSTAVSPAFVNGLLARIAELKASVQA